MADKALSQEEIDALLKGQDENAGAAGEGAAGDEASAQEATAPVIPEETAQEGAPGVVAEGAPADAVAGDVGPPALDEDQNDALGEFFNIAMGKAATVLSSLLQRTVEISTPSVTSLTWTEMREAHPIPSMMVKIQYRAGFEGDNLLVIEQRDANIIASLMEEEEDPLAMASEPLDDYRTGTVAEAMNQMVGGAAVSMSEMIGRDIDISPPSVNVMDFEEDVQNLPAPFNEEDKFLQVSFKFVVDDLVNSEMLQLMTHDFAARLASELLDEEEAQSAAAAPAPPIEEKPPEETAPAPMADAPVAQEAPRAAPEVPVTVGRAEFQPLTSQPEGPDPGGNYQIIMDVELDITVELGRTRMRVKDVLALGEGAIIELDKIVGEPVDIYANERLIARGEVVVIDEDFGVRIAEIVKRTEARSELR